MRTRNANTTHEGGRGRERKGEEGERGRENGKGGRGARGRECKVANTNTTCAELHARGVQIRIQKKKRKALRGEGIGRANACAMSNGRERARSSARASKRVVGVCHVMAGEDGSRGAGV
jgi:hypothetical protein